jgi:hypothetical protein
MDYIRSALMTYGHLASLLRPGVLLLVCAAAALARPTRVLP